ncbi:DUF397 domain-containing protein [Kitasatospora purpeofusca]|uniref:DUF397 domain-containing protein n=1 Tax=Kitasatospora purpeofusca TaxID=67352 RepID=UPI00386F9408
MDSPVDLSDAAWFKSSHSNNGGSWVEVTGDLPGRVPVRDSKDTTGPALLLPTDA